MALKNPRDHHLHCSYKEVKTGNENAPQTYADVNSRIESMAIMNFPEPTRYYEGNEGKLGTGQHGLSGNLQSIGTPFSISRVTKFSEFLYFLSFLCGKAITPSQVVANVYSQLIEMLGVNSLEMPTFTFEHGNETANAKYAGNVINSASITLPINAGHIIDASFEGWGNGHYPSSGTLTKLATGTMASAEEDLSSEPLINAKCCQVWIADALEGTFTQDPTGEDLDGNLVDITKYINTITIGINNGMTIDGAMRGGGCGIVNDWTRGLPAVTLEINLRKDVSAVDFCAFALADTPKAIEILYQGPIFDTTYRYAIDMFFPVIEIRGTTEDDAVPASHALTTKVYEDSDGCAFKAYAQTPIDEGYNAIHT